MIVQGFEQYDCDDEKWSPMKSTVTLFLFKPVSILEILKVVK